MSLSAVRIPAKTTPTAAVIILHGLGDSGAGWSFFSDIARRSSKFDHISFVFPNAPVRPITANSGFSMPGWFDIFQFGDPGPRQDVEGYLSALKTVREYIDEQQTRYGIPPERIILGGFSQGAALALGSLATLDTKIAGLLAFSGFLPAQKEIGARFNKTNIDTPVFQGHGDADTVISLQFAEQAHAFFKELGYSRYTFRAYPGLQHSCAEDELAAAFDLIAAALPSTTK